MVVGLNRTSYTGVSVGTILCSLWLLVPVVPVANIPYHMPAFCVTYDAALNLKSGDLRSRSRYLLLRRRKTWLVTGRLVTGSCSCTKEGARHSLRPRTTLSYYCSPLRGRIIDGPGIRMPCSQV